MVLLLNDPTKYISSDLSELSPMKHKVRVMIGAGFVVVALTVFALAMLSQTIMRAFR